MARTNPPEDYESLIQLIHARHGGMSRNFQKIAIYLSQNPNDIAVRSVNAIADEQGIHASNFVRFAQSLGFSGFKELQALFQRRLVTAAPGFNARIGDVHARIAAQNTDSQTSYFEEMVASDAAAVQALLDEIDQAELLRSGAMLAEADTIYLVGQLRSAAIVEILRYLLTMAGKKCLVLGPSGGLATHMARAMDRKDVLLAVSFRFYANETVSIVDEASARGIPIVAITDTALSPLAKSAAVLFALPENKSPISRSLTAPISLAQSIALAVASHLQAQTNTPKIPHVTGLNDR